MAEPRGGESEAQRMGEDSGEARQATSILRLFLKVAAFAW